MATKLVLLASSLAFLMVADASFIRTTVSEIEEVNPTRGACSTQIRGMDLTPCMYWMQHSGAWEMNPSTTEFKDQCCHMISKMDDECRCQALKDMVMEECQSPRMSQGQGMCGQGMMKKMMDVPRMCNRDFQSCHFKMILV